MKTLAILGASIVAAVAPQTVNAIPLKFTLSGTDLHLNSDQTVTPENVFAQWVLDSHPLADYYYSGAISEFDGVPGKFNYGTDLQADVDDLFFYAAGQYSPVAQSLFDSAGIVDIVGEAGKPFYTGNESRPTFQTGTFIVTDYHSNTPLTLTIGSVPEPETWLLMLAGFGIVGASLRVRRRSVAYSNA